MDVQREMGNDLKDAEMVLRAYNRYQTTEYNTTISRCRTAKQYEQFNAPGNIFQNLRWLPSRSADPRESHKLFWDKVWSKEDKFGEENTPGSLWNCKCDWEETNDPVTEGNPTGNKSKTGLHGNPALTGEVFSEDHPYFQVDVPEKTLKGILRKDGNKAVIGKKNESIILSLPCVGDTKVSFDGTSKDHISNDSAEGKDFMIPYIAENIFRYAKSSKCIATAPNRKPEEKKWAVKYYYFEIQVGDKMCYFNIEENNIIPENRYFFRFYSISNKLSEHAILI